jgi:hypothetical protein
LIISICGTISFLHDRTSLYRIMILSRTRLYDLCYYYHYVRVYYACTRGPESAAAHHLQPHYSRHLARRPRPVLINPSRNPSIRYTHIIRVRTLYNTCITHNIIIIHNDRVRYDHRNYTSTRRRLVYSRVRSASVERYYLSHNDDTV